jgi:hypothetical protein
MSQLSLSFTDLPLPQPQLWEQFDLREKQLIIGILARLMIQAARADSPEEPAHD